MSEGYINLFMCDDTSGNKPTFKGFMKIEGVDHEFALWPNKNGKKGFSGKYKVKAHREQPHEDDLPHDRWV